MRVKKLAVLLIMVLITLPFTYGGCIGGGGGGSDPVADNGTKPIIQSVALFKMVGTEWEQTLVFMIGDIFNFELVASDPDLDMSTIFVNQYLLPDVDAPYYDTAEVFLPAQAGEVVTYFLIEGTTIIGPVGQWRVCFWIVDEAGNESDEYCVNTIIEKSESAARYLKPFSNSLYGDITPDPLSSEKLMMSE